LNNHPAWLVRLLSEQLSVTSDGSLKGTPYSSARGGGRLQDRALGRKTKSDGAQTAWPQSKTRHPPRPRTIVRLFAGAEKGNLKNVLCATPTCCKIYNNKLILQYFYK